MSQEKKNLLASENDDTYGAAIAPASPEPSKFDRPTGVVTGFLYDHRASIPGYGMIRMVKGVSVYALYVLVAMLMAYLLNQLDRYTLPIVTSQAGYDLGYGTEICMANKNLTSTLLEENGIFKNATDICKNESYYYEPWNTTLNIK